MAKQKCTLKHGSVRINPDFHHSPKDKWNPKLQNMDGGSRHNGSGTNTLNIVQDFHDVEIFVRQNLLDEIVRAIQGIYDSVTSIPETGGIGALKGVQSAVQSLVFDDDRSLIVDWDYKFTLEPTDRKHDLSIVHNNVVFASLYKSQRSNLDRMEWETRSQVEFGAKREKLETFKKGSAISSDVYILNGKGQPDIIKGVTGGEKTITLYHRLTLRSIGFAKDLKQLIDDIIKAITNAYDMWGKVEALAEEKIKEWIEANTRTIKAAWYAIFSSDQVVPPADEDVEAQRKAEQDKLKADIIRKAKATIKALLDTLRQLIAEWQGKVELRRAELTIACAHTEDEKEEDDERADPPEDDEGHEEDKEHSEEKEQSDGPDTSQSGGRKKPGKPVPKPRLPKRPRSKGK